MTLRIFFTMPSSFGVGVSAAMDAARATIKVQICSSSGMCVAIVSNIFIAPVWRYLRPLCSTE